MFCNRSWLINHITILSENYIRKSLNEEAKAIIRKQSPIPVPVELTHFTVHEKEDFGVSHFRTQVAGELYFRYNVEELFKLAKLNAIGVLENEINGGETDETYDEKLGNIVGAVGEAGIGKTVLSKMVLNLTLDDNEQSFLFFLQLRYVKNFDKKMTLVDFLLDQHLPNKRLDRQESGNLLRVLSASPSVYIFIDGLDEIDSKYLNETAELLKETDEASPDQILKNLLSGRLLPRAKKFLTSRPGAFSVLHPEYKPSFTVSLLGLSEESQYLLCRRISNDESEYVYIVKRLRSNPGIARLCYNPMHCVLIIAYITKNRDDLLEVVSVTKVFTSAFYECLRHEHFKGNINKLAVLSELALTGMIENQKNFDYTKVSNDEKTLETCMKLKIANNDEIRKAEVLNSLKNTTAKANDTTDILVHEKRKC